MATQARLTRLLDRRPVRATLVEDGPSPNIAPITGGVSLEDEAWSDEARMAAALARQQQQRARQIAAPPRVSQQEFQRQQHERRARQIAQTMVRGRDPGEPRPAAFTRGGTPLWRGKPDQPLMSVPGSELDPRVIQQRRQAMKDTARGLDAEVFDPEKHPRGEGGKFGPGGQGEPAAPGAVDKSAAMRKSLELPATIKKAKVPSELAKAYADTPANKLPGDVRNELIRTGQYHRWPRGEGLPKMESLSDSALASVTRKGVRAVLVTRDSEHDEDVPVASFLDDLERKQSLRQVMGPPDDAKKDDAKKDDAKQAEGFWDDDYDDDEDECHDEDGYVVDCDDPDAVDAPDDDWELSEAGWSDEARAAAIAARRAKAEQLRDQTGVSHSKPTDPRWNKSDLRDPMYRNKAGFVDMIDQKFGGAVRDQAAAILGMPSERDLFYGHEGSSRSGKMSDQNPNALELIGKQASRNGYHNLALAIKGHLERRSKRASEAGWTDEARQAAAAARKAAQTSKGVGGYLKAMVPKRRGSAKPAKEPKISPEGKLLACESEYDRETDVQLDDHGQFSKEEVNYRSAQAGPDPDRVSCGTCRHFVEPGACRLVAGLIRKVDLCDKFEPRREGWKMAVRATLVTRTAEQDAPPIRPVYVEPDWIGENVRLIGQHLRQILGRQAEMVAEGFRSAEAEREVSPPGWSGTVKAMKGHPEIDNPWALAWYMHGKGDVPRYKPEAARRPVRAVLAG